MVLAVLPRERDRGEHEVEGAAGQYNQGFIYKAFWSTFLIRSQWHRAALRWEGTSCALRMLLQPVTAQGSEHDNNQRKDADQHLVAQGSYDDRIERTELEGEWSIGRRS